MHTYKRGEAKFLKNKQASIKYRRDLFLLRKRIVVVKGTKMCVPGGKLSVELKCDSYRGVSRGRKHRSTRSREQKPIKRHLVFPENEVPRLSSDRTASLFLHLYLTSPSTWRERNMHPLLGPSLL